MIRFVHSPLFALLHHAFEAWIVFDVLHGHGTGTGMSLCMCLCWFNLRQDVDAAKREKR